MYEATCLNDNTHKLTLEGVERADYTAFDAAVAQLKELAKYNKFTDDVKNAINAYVAKLENGDEVPLDLVADYTYEGVTIKGEQDKIDAVVKEITGEGGYIDQIENAKNNADYVKPDYTAWDAAEGSYDALTNEQLKNVKDEIITEVATLKETINNLKNSETANAKDDQGTVNDATSRLVEILAGIADGSLKDPDYTGAENAIENAEGIEDLTDAEKAIIEKAKEELQEIKDKTNPEANAKDDRDDVNAIKDKVQEIINKYSKCENGHTWGTPDLDPAPTATSNGIYTETCTVCGTTRTTEVGRANYEEFNTVVETLNNYAKNNKYENGEDRYTKETADKIADALAKAEALNKNYPADVTTAGGQFVEGGQEIINTLVEELKGVCAELNEGITNENALKPDYTAWDKAETAYDALSEEQIAKAAPSIIKEANDLIDAITALKADTASTKNRDQKTVDDATARLNDIIRGITLNETWILKPDFNGYDNSHKTYDKLVNTYGDSIKDSVTDDVANLDATVEGVRGDETATKADDQKTIDDAKTKLDAIIEGIENGTLRDADLTGAEEALGEVKEAAKDKDLVAGIDEEIKSIEDKLNEYENDSDATDQDDIDALEDRLDEILSGINDNSLVKPDYDAVDDKLEEANNAENLNKDTQDKIDAIEEALQKIKDKTEPKANYKDDQDDVDTLEDQLDEILKAIEENKATKPDFTDWDNAEKEYDALDKSEVDDDILDEVTKLKETIDALEKDPTANVADDQKTIGDAAERLEEIVDGIENGTYTHKWVESELVRPEYKDGKWTDGKYIYVCEDKDTTGCTATKTVTVKRADYTEYDKAVADLNALINSGKLT